MSPPKHLWSGDWRQESDDAAHDLANRRAQPGETEPQPVESPPARTRSGIRSRAAAVGRRLTGSLVPRVALMTALGVLIVAGAAYGLTALLNSGSDTSTGALTPPTATRPIAWLGMQIATVPPGAVAVVTVALGSQAERAGIEPGDAIIALNGQSVGATGDIAKTLSTLRIGDRIGLQIARGSTLFSTQVTFAARPSNSP
jgi:membrane-associated protease RseP (regulator of RpoE activity)